MRAVVIGGVGSLIVTGLWSTLFPDLRHADELTSEALLRVDERLAAEEAIASPVPVAPGVAPDRLSAGSDLRRQPAALAGFRSSARIAQTSGDAVDAGESPG